MNSNNFQTLNVAFIGGAINSAVGYTHFNACRLDGYFDVSAGCFSRDEAQNQLTARTYGVTPGRTYRTWQDLLQHEKNTIDAVVVLTPTPSHVEIVLQALAQGFAVICEKALGASSQECLAMQAAVETHQGFLAVTFNYSGYPMVRELRHMMNSGRLGTIQQVHIEMPQEGFLRQGANPQQWRRKDYAVPTVSLDLGVHVHHLVDFLLNGKKVQSVLADQASYGGLGVVDNVYSLTRYEGDVRVQAWWGKTALGYRNGLRIRVFGNQGSAEWYQLEPENLRLCDNDGQTLLLDRGSGQVKLAREARYNRFKPGHPSGFIEAFANLYADIAFALRRHKNNMNAMDSYVAGAQQAAEGLQWLERIQQAAKTE